MDKNQAKHSIQEFCLRARKLINREDLDHHDWEDFCQDSLFIDEIHELILDYISEPELSVGDSFKERVIKVIMEEIVNRGELYKVFTECI